MPTKKSQGAKGTATKKSGRKDKGPEKKSLDSSKGLLKSSSEKKFTDDDCPTGQELAPQSQLNREITSFNIRHEAAVLEYNRDAPILTTHPSNGDEEKYQQPGNEFENRFIASYTKGLPLRQEGTPKKDNRLGEVDPKEYCKLLKAIKSGEFADFEKVNLGSSMASCPPSDGPGSSGIPRSLENPQGALAFDLEGADSHEIFTEKVGNVPVGFPPAPPFESKEIIGEIAENYWMALLRDVPFSEYENPAPPVTPGAQPLPSGVSPTTAAQDLSNFQLFKDAEPTHKVTPATLFRGNFDGDRVGPYVSQFLLRDIPYGSQVLSGKIRVVAAKDYMVTEENWRNVQRGCDFDQECTDDFRYITSGRDLGQFVHVDNDYYGNYNACLLLVNGAVTRRCEAPSEGLGIQFAKGLPYKNPNTSRPPASNFQSKNQIGVCTFGPQQLKSLLLEAMNRALKAVWYQKWSVHRRLRPEALGGRIHFKKLGVAGADYPLNPTEYPKLDNVLGKVYGKYNTYLLPMAYAEGSPLHPSYGQGHATVAGACITVLKAFFADDTFDNLELPVFTVDKHGARQPYTGTDRGTITIHGELNKLASNIGLGRDFAGVHYRSDYLNSVFLGEQLAITLLEDQNCTFNEKYKISFKKFNGQTYTLNKGNSGPC